MVGDARGGRLGQSVEITLAAAGSSRVADVARPVTWSTRAAVWPISVTTMVTGCQNTVVSGWRWVRTSANRAKPSRNNGMNDATSARASAPDANATSGRTIGTRNASVSPTIARSPTANDPPTFGR